MGYKAEIRRLVGNLSPEDQKRLQHSLTLSGIRGEVFAGVMAGLKNHEIAQKLDRHQSTVQAYLRAVLLRIQDWIQRDGQILGDNTKWDNRRVANVAWTLGDVCQHESEVRGHTVISWVAPVLIRGDGGQWVAKCPVCSKPKRRTRDHFRELEVRGETMQMEWCEVPS